MHYHKSVMEVYFHTIKSILNWKYHSLLKQKQVYFHTIKSILNFQGMEEVTNRFEHFHTIKSILNKLVLAL